MTIIITDMDDKEKKRVWDRLYRIEDLVDKWMRFAWRLTILVVIGMVIFKIITVIIE